jgi:hypothetical protein
MVVARPAAAEFGLRVRPPPIPRHRHRHRIADDVIVEDSWPAAPSVRTVTKKSGRLPYWPRAASGPPRRGRHSAITSEDTAISAALATWNAVKAALPRPRRRRQRPREVGRDRVNLIFRDTEWCRPPSTATPPAASAPRRRRQHRPRRRSRGRTRREIIDADVEPTTSPSASLTTARAPHRALRPDPPTPWSTSSATCRPEHTCRAPPTCPASIQRRAGPQRGDTTIPSSPRLRCTPLPDCGETKKASLEQDDVDATCRSYPLADDPGECAPPDELGGGCCDAGGTPTGSLALALLLFLAVVTRRTCRRY